jgi:hypothetical protein
MPWRAGAHICRCLRRPGIDSEELIRQPIAPFYSMENSVRIENSQPRFENSGSLYMSPDFLKKKKNVIFYFKISTTIHEPNYRAEIVPH